MTSEHTMGSLGEAGPFDFPGSEGLIAAVAKAVEESDSEAITEGVKQGLCRLIGSRDFELPNTLLQPVAGHYARRFLYKDAHERFSIVAMTWGPEQGTPLHDHCGLWCVEGVCCGVIRVEQYALQEREGERYRFSREDVVRAQQGSAGCLIPPHEYHRIINDRADEVAVTLHIYGGDMASCNVFTPERDDWYLRERKPLAFDG